MTRSALSTSKRQRVQPLRAANQAKQDGFLDSEEDGSVNDEQSDGGDDGDEINTIIEVEEGSSDDEDETADEATTNALSDVEMRQMAIDGFVDMYYGPSRTLGYEASNMFEGSAELTPEARTMRSVDLFFLFLPKRMWRNIAAQTNKYEHDTSRERMRKARARNDSLPERQAEARLARSRKKIEEFEKIKPVEILHAMGLLIARSLMPYKAGIEKHWATTSTGAIPAGKRSQFMPASDFEMFSSSCASATITTRALVKIALGRSSQSLKFFKTFHLDPRGMQSKFTSRTSRTSTAPSCSRCAAANRSTVHVLTCTTDLAKTRRMSTHLLVQPPSFETSKPCGRVEWILIKSGLW